MAPKDGTSRGGDGHNSYVSSYRYFKGKKIKGPIRLGPHADTQANSDLQVLRTAATSLDSLRTAASELKAEAAASDPTVERNERSWKKLRTADESGVSQPASSSVLTCDGGGAKLL